MNDDEIRPGDRFEGVRSGQVLIAVSLIAKLGRYFWACNDGSTRYLCPGGSYRRLPREEAPPMDLAPCTTCGRRVLAFPGTCNDCARGAVYLLPPPPPPPPYKCQPDCTPAKPCMGGGEPTVQMKSADGSRCPGWREQVSYRVYGGIASDIPDATKRMPVLPELRCASMLACDMGMRRVR